MADELDDDFDDEQDAQSDDEAWKQIRAVAGNMDRRERRMFREKTRQLVEWRDENNPHAGIDMLLVGEAAEVVGDLSLAELYRLVALHYAETDSRSAE